jgi:hypothetical protein
VMTLTVAGALAATAVTAHAQDSRSGFRHGWGYELGRQPQRHDVPSCAPAPVVVDYRDEIVGYEDCWVDRPVTVYETRTLYRQQVVGYDHCGRPIVRSVPVCEQVPVCRTERVCEKRPIYQKRPVHSARHHSWGIHFSLGR